MRQDRIIQASIFDLFSEHEIGRELKAHERVAGRASRGDRLGRRRAVPPGPQANRARWAAGRVGVALRAAQAIPAAELRGTGVSSVGLRVVSRPLLGCRCIGARRSRSCKRRSARSAPGPGSGSIAVYWPAPARTKVETGTLLRLDSTVTETMIHEPSDSWLLCDAMRIMVRLLGRRRRSAAGAGHCLA